MSATKIEWPADLRVREVPGKSRPPAQGEEQGNG